MANKLISEMGLPKHIANIFAAHALSLTEFELMELLGVSFADVASAVAHISAIVSPPCQTALSLMEQRLQSEGFAGHLPTGLKGLDDALCGGIPLGVLTEFGRASWNWQNTILFEALIVGFTANNYGGLDGHVIDVDVEFKFRSRRLTQIGVTSFPDIFNMKEMAKEMAGRIHVLRPGSLEEFTDSLQQIKALVLQDQVRLLIIDSMAALVSGESDRGAPGHRSFCWSISFIKSLAEFSRIPVLVTNQVRSHSCNEVFQYSFQAPSSSETPSGVKKYGSHLVAALGFQWAHDVTIRLILESKSGHRFIKVTKSPISPPLAFPFSIASSGISLLDDDGVPISERDKYYSLPRFVLAHYCYRTSGTFQDTMTLLILVLKAYIDKSEWRPYYYQHLKRIAMNHCGWITYK